MKIVYRAADITEAEIVKGMLLSNDIEAHASGYYLQGGIGETSPMDLARVHVADEDYDSAREILREYEGKHEGRFEADSLSDSETHTPTANIAVTVLVIIVVAIFSFWVGI